MYTVKASSHTGPVSFACGTPEQALDRVFELTSRGFKDIAVTDPSGKVWTAAAFERSLDG